MLKGHLLGPREVWESTRVSSGPKLWLRGARQQASAGKGPSTGLTYLAINNL